MGLPGWGMSMVCVSPVTPRSGAPDYFRKPVSRVKRYAASNFGCNPALLAIQIRLFHSPFRKIRFSSPCTSIAPF